MCLKPTHTKKWASQNVWKIQIFFHAFALRERDRKKSVLKVLLTKIFAFVRKLYHSQSILNCNNQQSDRFWFLWFSVSVFANFASPRFVFGYNIAKRSIDICRHCKIEIWECDQYPMCWSRTSMNAFCVPMR